MTTAVVSCRRKARAYCTGNHVNAYNSRAFDVVVVANVDVVVNSLGRSSVKSYGRSVGHGPHPVGRPSPNVEHHDDAFDDDR